MYLAVYDLSDIVQLDAKLGIATTLIVCIVLGAGAWYFSKITSELVIDPIENMIDKINKITENPLLAAEKEEEKFILDDMHSAENPIQKDKNEIPHDKKKKEVEQTMETVLL